METIEITKDFRVPGTDIIVESGDQIQVMEASATVLALEGSCQDPKVQNFVKKILEQFNITKVVSGEELPVSISSRIASSEIVSHVNELKAIADKARENTLIIWPSIEPALRDRVIVLSMPQGNY